MRRLRIGLDKDDTIIRRHRRRRPRPRPRPHRRLGRRCRRRAVADHRRSRLEKAWRRRVRAPLHLVRRGRHASVEFLSPVRLRVPLYFLLLLRVLPCALLRLSHPSVPHSASLSPFLPSVA